MSEFTPQEQQIADALQIPAPESTFYARMSRAPWSPSARQPKRLRHMLIGSACAAALVGTVLFVPPLRSLAQDIIDTLFTRYESDERTFTYTAEEYIPAASMTVNEIMELSSGTVRFPDYLPEGFVFYEGHYDPETRTASLSYQFTAGGRGITIEQRPHSEAQNLEELGASAAIETVEIGALTGAYAQGAWIIIEAPPDVRPGDVVENVTVWNSDVSLRRLQWQDGEWIFRIFAGGGSPDHPGFVDRDEMIQIAESLITGSLSAESP